MLLVCPGVGDAARFMMKIHPTSALGFAGSLATVGLGVLLASTACAPDRSDAGAPEADVELISELSSRYAARIGPTLAKPVEGRFVDEGRFVVILDRFSPHLHLFSSEGDWLWTGGEEGDGPGELRVDLGFSLGSMDRRVVVAQRGRLSLWSLEGDTLALERVVPLPAHYAPQGLVEGCDGDWLFYGRDQSGVDIPDEGWSTLQAPELPFLHRLRVEGDTVVIDPLWSDDPDIIGWQVNNQGAILDRRAERVTVLHRPFMYAGHGRYLEFDCSGRILHSVDELGLINGDSFPVLAPRSRALGTYGTVALEEGFLTATGRFFSADRYDIEDHMWLTEIFRFKNGVYHSSVLIPRRWYLFDVDPDGRLLMSTRTPEPYFIRVPVEAVHPGAGGSRP